MRDVTPKAADFLTRHDLVFLSAHQLYQLWQGAKDRQIDIFGLFQRIHASPGGVFALKGP